MTEIPSKEEYLKVRENRVKQLFDISQDPDRLADELGAMVDILGDIARTTPIDEFRIVTEMLIDVITLQTIQAHMASEEAKEKYGNASDQKEEGN